MEKTISQTLTTSDALHRFISSGNRKAGSMISRIVELTDLDIPGLQYYLTLKRPVLHREQGIFIIEGDKVIERFLESNLTAISFLLTPEWLERCRERVDRRPEPVEIYVGSRKLFEQIIGFKYHQGVMGVARVPVQPSLDQVVSNVKGPVFLAAIENLESAENVGVVVRNCAACGVHAIIVGETTADPYLRRAVRNSMGTVFSMTVIYSTNLIETIIECKERYGIDVYAAHPRPGSFPLYDADLTKSCCIVLGNEGKGVTETLAQACTASLRIPMAPDVDSFNVACAGAIFFYEGLRQRFASGKDRHS